jgi:hypothetical protein
MNRREKDQREAEVQLALKRWDDIGKKITPRDLEVMVAELKRVKDILSKIQDVIDERIF